MQEYVVTTFPNYGYIQSEFSEADIAPIKQEIIDIPDVQEQYHTFSGQRIIRKEYELFKTKHHMEKLMMPYVSAYLNTFQYDKEINVLTKPAPLVLDKMAVNFLDKHETNLPHHHDGVFSFIIWIDIALGTSPSFVLPTEGDDSNFALYYTDVLGHIKEFIIPVNREWENNFILFPSGIQHSVRPCFGSDNYRTSVSGTFKFQV